MTKEPAGYALEPHHLRKLESIAQRLDDPRVLSFDARRDLANLLNLVLSEIRQFPIDERFD